MIQASDASVWHASLFGDDALVPLFSEAAFVERFRRFELALTRSLGAHGLVEAHVADAAMDAIAKLEVDLRAMRVALKTDGVPVPEFVRQLKGAAGGAASAIHVGATSQDLVDTATVLALKEADLVIGERLGSVIGALGDLRDRFGGNALMGRTRMQAALPITVDDRLSSWVVPLQRHAAHREGVLAEVAVLQFGGPVGLGPTVLGDKGYTVAEAVATELGLGLPDRPWHSDRSRFVAYANWLAMVTGTLGKVGQDIVLMAQQGIDAIELAAGGASSAMPHKRNPVLAEKLVTTARHNAAMLGGLQQAMVHEQERSGSAWMLEWMILPQMVVVTGRALTDAAELLGAITGLGTPDKLPA